MWCPRGWWPPPLVTTASFASLCPQCGTHRASRRRLQVVSEMYIMYATAQCIPCTAEELQEFAVAAAKANSIERHAATVAEAAEQEVVAAERQLEMAVEQ